MVELNAVWDTFVQVLFLVSLRNSQAPLALSPLTEGNNLSLASAQGLGILLVPCFSGIFTFGSCHAERDGSEPNDLKGSCPVEGAPTAICCRASYCLAV